MRLSRIIDFCKELVDNYYVNPTKVNEELTEKLRSSEEGEQVYRRYINRLEDEARERYHKILKLEGELTEMTALAKRQDLMLRTITYHANKDHSLSFKAEQIFEVFSLNGQTTVDQIGGFTISVMPSIDSTEKH